MKAIIVASGRIKDYQMLKKYTGNSYIIGVDGGAYHLKKIDIVPHLLIGDFDSIKINDYKYFTNKNVSIIKAEREKDFTDTHLAINEAIKKGFKEIYMFGCTGSRLDHTLGNIFLLKYTLKKGVNGIIIDENNLIYLIEKEIVIDYKKGYKVSLIAVSEEVKRIYSTGLYYDLKGRDISLGETVGISNEFTEKRAKITFEKGLLLVIISKD